MEGDLARTLTRPLRNCMHSRPGRATNSRVAGSLVLAATLLAVSGLARSQAPASADSADTKGVGWAALANTQLSAKCPDLPEIQGVEGCRAIFADWNGGLADTKRNRLILWGGGHNGYFGNEMYALDLEKQTLERITEPSAGSALANLSSCPEAYADGKPNARHTYNGLQYLAKNDAYFLFGAGLSPCGNFSNGVWLFDPTTSAWAQKRPKNHPNPAQNGSAPMTAYDSADGMIYEVEGNAGVFWKYDSSADNWTNLGAVAACSRLNMTAAVDPQRKLYFCVGASMFNRINLSGARKVASLKGKGCDELVAAAGPGFDYDSSQGRMVGWAGGDTVYVYDVETDSCTTRSLPGGPGAAQKNGTFGRFRYFPALREFVLMNDWKQDAYVLRLD
jgi:hypothetical protein